MLPQVPLFETVGSRAEGIARHSGSVAQSPLFKTIDAGAIRVRGAM